MKVIIDKYVPFVEGVLEPYAEVVYADPADINPQTVKDVDALIVRTRTKCNEQLLEGSKVRFVATATIGHDHIDVAYCDEKGIVWQNAAGCNATAVRQYTCAAIQYLAEHFQMDLTTKTLGIVGVGHVGKLVEETARNWGMKVLLCDPPRARVEGSEGFVTLQEIAAKADIITFHTPLQKQGLDATYHICDAQFLSMLKPEACIINAARGGIIDEAALLDTHFPSRAVIDCWEGEPRLNLTLLEKVLLGTFHIAGYSLLGKVNASTQSIQGLAHCFGLKDLYEWKAPLPEDYDPNAFYDIQEDDRALRATPHLFEIMRDTYPLR